MKILKTIIYHLFLALRGIFFLIFNFIAGLLGLGVIVSFGFYLFDDMTPIGAPLAVLAMFIVVYFIKHFYDKIIFWAKPDDIDLTLFK